MNKSVLGQAAAALGVLTGALPSTGQVLYFDFNTTPATPPPTTQQLAGNPSLSLSGDTVVPAGATGTAFTDLSGNAHAAGLAGAFSSGVDAGNEGVLLTMNTTGFRDFHLRLDYRASSTGPSQSTLAYRLGGTGSFVPITTDTFLRDAAFHALIYDLSGLDALENKPLVELLWSGFQGGGGSGTLRLDNLEVDALATVPEPKAATILAGAGLLAFGAVQARRRTAGAFRTGS